MKVKKIVSFFLTLIMLFSTFAAICNLGVSAQEVGETIMLLRKKFSADLKGNVELENEGHLGIPVNISTFYRDGVTPNGVALLYVVGHNEERLGTDSDEEIIEDFLADGYSVTVLDYMNNPKAKGNEFSWSVHKLFTGNFLSKKYDFGYVRTTYNNMYVVPSGCRIEREVYFYSLDTMGINGTNEYAVWLWNNFYAGPDGLYKDANKNDLPYAETIDDMIKKDGSPVDFDLRMDIVYPSNPKDTVPVFALASSSEERTGSLRSAVRPYFTTALLQGYAGVIYDHEYIPMSRTDHYAYFGNYTLAPFSSYSYEQRNSNAVHSAAIRRIRYLESTYGYDADYIAAWGFSKSCTGPAILANTKHEEMGEIKDFGIHVPEGKDPKAYQGEQPWLYYEGTNEKISSLITVAYAGAGTGIGVNRELLITEDAVPFASSIGTEDTMGSNNSHIAAAKNYLDNHPEIESDFLIPEGLGHNPAYGYDNVKQIEQFNEIWTWLDNHVRAAYREESPEVMWVTPQSNVVFDALEEPVRIKFSRAMDIESVKANVKIIRLADGKEMAGTWNVLHGATTFEFTSPSVINGSSYEVLIGENTKAKDGVELKTAFSKVFTISGDKLLSVYADTYVSSKEPDKNYGSDGTLTVVNKETDHNRGLLSFKNEGGFKNVTKAYLVLNRYDDKKIEFSVYGTDNFDENTVTYNNAPANKEKITTAATNSEITTIDVSDYVVKADGDTVSFAFETEKEDVYLYHSFDNYTSSTMTNNVDYRFGGEGIKMKFSSEAKVGASCLHFYDRKTEGRIKFLKSFGTEKLTSDLLGKTAKASFWVKTENTSTVDVAVYEYAAYTGIHKQSFAVKPGEWTFIEYLVKIDQAMIDGNNRAVTIVPPGTGDFWLDDFKCELATGTVTLATKEYSGEKQKVSANLVLYAPEIKEFSGEAKTVAAGESADTILNGENYVSGYKNENTNDTVKGYIKFPIEEFDANSDSVSLKLKATSSGTSQFSVYGVLADDSRFAENFTKGITWNTAYANQIEGNGVDENKTVFIGKKTVTGSENFEFDVKDYVKTMKDLGYKAVTFIVVQDTCGGLISKVTFENMEKYWDYSVSSTLPAENVTVAKDPTNANNSVLYIKKNGTIADPNSYQQNVYLTGLIKPDNIFEESDIGKIFKVSFKFYAEGPSDTVGNYCALGVVGAQSPGVSHTGVTRTVSSTKTGVWNTVTFTINVNESILGDKATALAIGSGWSATGLYVDDIIVEEISGDLQIEMDFTPGTVDFEGMTTYDKIELVNPDNVYGVTTDPVDANNKVFYYERDHYYYSVSFMGLITPTNKFTAADVGKKYTVTFRQFNVNAGGTAGIAATIDNPKQEQYFLNSKMTIDRYVDGKLNNTDAGVYGLSSETWHNVRFEIEVTEEMIGLGSTIVLSSNNSTTKIYVDDITVTVEGGSSEDSVSPTLNFVKSGEEEISNVSLVALVSGKDKNAISTVPNATFDIKKSSKGGESGLAKTYVSFDNSIFNHIMKGTFKFDVEAPVSGSTLKLYALTSATDINKLTWNNAYGNNTVSVGMKSGSVIGGSEIATITLTDETSYSVDVSEEVITLEADDKIMFVLAADDGVQSHKVNNFKLDIAGVIYTDTNELPTLDAKDGVLSLKSPYRVDYGIKKVEFFIDGKTAIGEATVNGQITKISPVISAGTHSAYAVVTYADGKTVQSSTIDFTVEDQIKILRGDANGDGKVDAVDLAVLKLYLAGLNDDVKYADCNNDDKIDAVDLAILKLILAGIEK